MKKVIKGLASAKLTIFLFFTLAATSVFGTVVAQGLPQEHYERLYGPVVMFLIQVFDITDMYHSWWVYASCDPLGRQYRDLHSADAAGDHSAGL